MKISPIQIVASAAAAVASAVLLSFLGTKGTIIGVGLGSVIATLGSAAIGESLRRGHSKIKAVASSQQWRVPGIGAPAGGTADAGSADGGTADAVQSSADAGTAGPSTSSGNAAAAPAAPRTQPTSPSTPEETIRPLARYSSADRAQVRGAGGVPTGRPAAPRSAMAAGRAVAGPPRRPGPAPGSVFGVRWRVLVAATIVVAALAVGVVLLIQAVSGQSLGHSLGGGGGPAPTSVPPTPVSGSTTTTAPRATTTTTAPRATTTTTTAPRATTTTSPGATTSTTPQSSGAASGSPSSTTSTTTAG